MPSPWTRLAPMLLLLAVWPARAADRPEPLPGERDPVLRLEAGGPTSLVSALAFSPDGTALYAAGRDKVVRVWVRDAGDRRFEPGGGYRVPIGPGPQGALNAVAVSPDGVWLAAAGSGPIRQAAGLREQGLVWVPLIAAFTDDMLQDQGTIYLFNTRDQTLRRLRGHKGAVWALAFAPDAGGRPLLASVSRDWDARTGKHTSEARLWDVTPGKSLAAAPGLPDPGAGQPGLAVWRTGDRPEQARVALALADARLRVWDVAANTFATLPDGINNFTLAYQAEGRKLLSGSFVEQGGGKSHGNLQEWDAAKGGPARGAARPQRGENEQAYYFPLALTLLSSRPGQAPDHAAIVYWVTTNKKEDYRLRVVRLRDLELVKEVVVWQWPGIRPLIRPVVAASRGGKHLAVAGNPEHAIHVYAIEDLLTVDGPRPRAEQVLHNVGLAVRHLAWARKGDERGLLLGPSALKPGDPPGPAAGDLILRLVRPAALTPERDGWKVSPRRPVAEADFQTWQAANKGKAATAVAAASAGRTRLLAVGYEDEDHQPHLGLFDAAGGQQLRELTGHVAAVRALVFTEDGRRLASAADDLTVNVWDLDDLDQLLGQRGMLRGVAVAEAEGKPGAGLVVVAVEKGAPAAEKLGRDDIIVGLVEKGVVRPFETARDFYATFALLRPGATVALRLRGKQEDVRLNLDQAVDERKPLVSLFVTQERDWIGWSPLGPYEASGPRAERYIGWHVASDRPDRPPAFALANQYRKYHRPGLLQRLVEAGTLPEKEEPPPRPPGLTLWLDEVGPDPKRKDAEGVFPLPRRAATLKLAIDDYPLDRVESVTWRLGELQGAFRPESGRVWSADLTPRLTWGRGVQRVRAVVRARGDEPREYLAELAFRYQPPPPQLVLKRKAPAKPLAVDREDTVVDAAVEEAAFDVEADAKPAAGGESVTLTLRHNGRDVMAPKNGDVDTQLSLRERLTLREGLNVIEVVAANRDAPAGAARERRRLVLQVVYQRKPDPVRLLVRAVVPLPEGTGPRLDVERDKAVVVHVPEVRVEGVIETPRDVRKAIWRQGEGPEEKLEVGSGKDFSQRIRLDPGRRSFTFAAENTDGAKDAKMLTLDYRPRPPDVELDQPAALYEGEHSGPVEIKGRLIPPPDRRPHPYEAVVLVNGQAEPRGRVEIDPKARAVKVRVPLQPGATYRVQVRLANEWKEAAESTPVLVSYLSPPVDIRFRLPAGAVTPLKVDRPVIDLEALVSSRLDITKVEAEAQGEKEDRARPLIGTPAKQPAGQPWLVTLKGVPLVRGRNEVRLWASNEQGRSRKPGTLVVLYEKPAQPPVVRFLDPPPGAEPRVRDRKFAARFQVVSAMPLLRIELVRGRQVLYRDEGAAAQGQKNAAGLFELTVTVPVELVEQEVNVLEAVAVSEDGPGRAVGRVSHVAPPVRLEIDDLLPEGGDPVRPERRHDGELVFAKMPNGRLTLRGRVVWDSGGDPRLRQDGLEVRAYVNGFQQEPAPLRPAAGSERAFEAALVLNRPRDNRIELLLPEVPWNDDNRPRVRVAECAQPRQGPWLHLLLLGGGETDEERLLAGVLKGLRAERHEGHYRTPVFDQVVPHVLTSATADITEQAVRTQCRLIQLALRRRAQQGYPNDVVLVYYQGGEIVGGKKHLLFPGEGQAPATADGSAIRLEVLAEFFQENPGAQLLFLDVLRPGPALPADDQVPQWPHQPRLAHVGVFRCAWAAGAGPPPAQELRLRQALEDALPRASRLKDVEDGLRSRFEQVGRKHPQALEFYPYLHDFLKDVVVNRPPP